MQGALPCVEFIAPELGTFSISMTLSAALGVNPMREADSLGAMCKRGEVNRLILGGLNWGKVIIESVTQDWRNSGPGGRPHHRPDAGPEGVPLMPVVDMREAAPLVIGATGLDAVVQNIRMILTTFAYSVPLDRAFRLARRLHRRPGPGDGRAPDCGTDGRHRRKGTPRRGGEHPAFAG